MPELAEVEFFRKQWEAGLGEQVERVEFHPKARVFREANTKLLQAKLPGSRFASAEAHGKQMLFGFEPGLWLSVHLGMTGKLFVAGEDWRPDKHDHLQIYLSNQTLVFRDPRMFGRVGVEAGDAPPLSWSNLPPAILTSGYTKERLSLFLARHPNSLIKPLLLNQEGFPGIGNWMADEILWRLAIHPTTRCKDLPPETAEKLWKELRKLCRESIKVIGTDWSDPPDSWLFNHRWKDGGVCPRRGCRTDLVRETVRGRTSCWCPACQTP